MDEFGKKILELEEIFTRSLLPGNNNSERSTFLNILIEYDSTSFKRINVIFNSGSALIKNESFFLFKKNDYFKLNDHVCQLFCKYIPKSSSTDNVMHIPFNKVYLDFLISFFKDWKIEWITKWNVLKVFENDYDLIISVDSENFSDDQIFNFFNNLEKKLKKHYLNVH